LIRFHPCMEVIPQQGRFFLPAASFTCAVGVAIRFWGLYGRNHFAGIRTVDVHSSHYFPHAPE
ncbi:MAG: hypothetical protein ABI877_02140, partial [Gemmatimonadaceae bacterium]